MKRQGVKTDKTVYRKMANLLAPRSEELLRRGSWQPGINHITLDEPLRRYSVTENNNHDPPVSPLERIRKSITIVDTAASFFRVKPWSSSDDTFTSESKDLSQRSLNGSSSSLKTSPLMCRNDLDKFDFFIPKSTNTVQKQVSVLKEPRNLGSLDISQYLSNDEALELKECGPSVKLGEVKFCFAYNEQTEKLKIILKSVEVNLKPSSAVVGCNWACDAVVFVDILPDKKKSNEISIGSEFIMDIKKGDFNGKTLRLTIYDNRRKHVKLPIGHALQPLRDVANKEKFNIYSKKLNFYSQPAGFNKGRINITLSWAVSSKRLEIKIGNAWNLKSEYGVDGKEHFLKLNVFVSGSKQKSYKTVSLKATPGLNFMEKFSLPITPVQFRDYSFVFQLYMKNTTKKMLTSKILTGTTVIGPYMKRGSDRHLTHWEKMISNPPDEVTESHTLFL